MALRLNDRGMLEAYETVVLVEGNGIVGTGERMYSGGIKRIERR